MTLYVVDSVLSSVAHVSFMKAALWGKCGTVPADLNIILGAKHWNSGASCDSISEKDIYSRPYSFELHVNLHIQFLSIIIFQLKKLLVC